MNQHRTDRTHELRTRLYSAFGYGFVTRAAKELGLSRPWVSEVLNGRRSGEATLEKLEALLEKEAA